MDPNELQIAILVGALLVVAAAAALAPRLRIPAPLILVVIGIALSLLPFVNVEIEPELVLAGILPPLLYSSSVSMPAMDLRREFGTISGLSVLLVVVSSLLLGWLFTILIPGLNYGLAVALGAVISPTDAVATSIVKRANVSHRVTAILEGESLLNDASALVVLKTAVIAGIAIAVDKAQPLSVPFLIGQFVYAVVVAVVIGIVVGRFSIWVRSRVTDPTVSTVISFAVPFVVSLPAERIGASGLVAAVAAGLAVGRQAPRRLTAEDRRSDTENWATVNLLLEGAIFLLMGLEISTIVNKAGGTAVAWSTLPIALAGLGAVIVIRALFVTPLLLLLKGGRKRKERFRGRLEEMQRTIAEGQPALEQQRQEYQQDKRRRPLRPLTTRDFENFTKRVKQALADVDYLSASPLGPREGAVVVWAGMRGAVTVAAAQTINDVKAISDYRDTLILVAFGVAAISLLLQGGTLSLLIRVLKPNADDPGAKKAEQAKVMDLIRETAGMGEVREVSAEERRAGFQDRLSQIQKARVALLDARDEGVFSADVLGNALDSLDAMELAMDVRRNAQS